MKVTVKRGQSLTDIAMQVYGSPDGVADLAKDNGLSVTDKVPAGTQLDYSSDKVIDSRVVTYYQTNDIVPVTGFAASVDIGTFDNTFDDTFD